MGMMSAEENKALVLRPSTRFLTSVITRRPRSSGRRPTSSIAPIYRRAAMACSTLSAAYQIRSAMRMRSYWQRATM